MSGHMPRRARAAALLLAVLSAFGARSLRAFELPPICAEPQIAAVANGDVAKTPLPRLRARVEKLTETDPNAAVALMCATIPRVAREQGEGSAAMAWWVGSLATPLIAFMDRFAEALPLLRFAQPILERRMGPYAAELADIHVAYAWIATRQGRNSDAVAAWQDALRIREHTPGARKIELQKVLVGLALTQSMQRDFPAAKAALARAQAILVENGETGSEAAAAIQNAYVNIAWREEDYASVRRHAEAQIRIEEQMGGPTAQRVPAYIWLGQGLERLDELDDAEAALRKAVEISESKQGAPLQRHYFVALAHLAALLVTRGKPREGLAVAEHSIAVGERSRGGDAPQLVAPLQCVGDAERALGDLPAALRAYERAGAIIEKHPRDIERPYLVAQYRGLARLQLEVGERDESHASLAAAFEAAGTDPTLVMERGSILQALGTLAGTEDPNTGRAQLQQSLALYRSRLPDTHPAILRVITETCALEMQSDPRHSSSCDDAAQRIEHSPDVDPYLRHDVYAVRSELSGRRQDFAQAYDLAIRALAAAETLNTPDPLWRADFALARLERGRNEPALAIYLGKESIGQIERLRGRFADEDRRLERGFLEDKVGVYRTVADWLMEAGRVDEGLDVLRLLKSQELYDFTLREAQWVRGENGVELAPAELALRRRYESMVKPQANPEIERLGRLQESGRISAAERRRLSALLAGEQQLEAARAARIRDFLAGGGGPATNRAAHDIKVGQLAREQAKLGADTALAFYLLTDTRLRMVIATRLGQYEYESPVDGPALKRDIGRFLEAIGRREEVRGAAGKLYDTMARPLDEQARRAGATQLVLWLDGALRYVPFAVLHDGQHYLVERYSVESYVPPIETRGGSAPAPTAAVNLRVRGLGLTRGVAGYAPLPAMADELCDVVHGPIAGLEAQGRDCPRLQFGAGALEGEGFADAAFTEERLRSLLADEGRFSVLHLGTHFSLRPGNARRSFLVLGDGSRLTLEAIGGLDFSGLRLVTLSACQSGLGGATGDDGREIEGLSAIVQRRGAARVVASLWQVEDRSTAYLMREMYAALSAPKANAATALRHAQLRLRALSEGRSRRYEHPYYWGGFLVSGSGQ